MKSVFESGITTDTVSTHGWFYTDGVYTGAAPTTKKTSATHNTTRTCTDRVRDGSLHTFRHAVSSLKPLSKITDLDLEKKKHNN